MIMCARGIVAVFILALAPTLAHARPQVIEANDASGEPIRKAALAFLQKLEAGDGPGARGLFAGDETQAQLLSSFMTAAVASNALGDAMKKHYGELPKEMAEQFGLRGELQGTIRTVKVKTMIRDGQRASLSPGVFLDQGLELQQVGRDWKVIALTANPKKAPKMIAFLDAFTKAANGLAAEVKTNKFKKPDDAIASLVERVKPAAEALMNDGKAGAESPAIGSPAPRSLESDETPLAVARAYTDLFKSRNAAKAVETHWDFDVIFTGIFGDDLKKHTDAEVRQMKTMLMDFLKRLYADPRISEGMANATYSDFVSKTPEAGRAEVTFTVTFGDHRVKNSLILQRNQAKKWRIVDAGTNDRLMIALMRQEYLKAPKEATPMDYVKALVSGG